MVEFFIAKKQMLARKKQTLVSIIGVAIGITVLTVALAISNGLDKNMIGSLLSLSPHIDVRGNITKDNIENIKQIDGIEAVIEARDNQGILKYNGPFGSYVSGVKILGLNYEEALKSKEISSKIVSGNFNQDDNATILIGQELAKSLDLVVGDTITLVSSQNIELDLKISGIFQSGFYDFDINMVLLPLKTAIYLDYSSIDNQKLMIKLKNPFKADFYKQEINRVFKDNEDNFYISTWGEQNKALLSAIHLEKTVMLIVLSLIILIAAFLIWNILNTLVREKIKDIGILRAYGYSKKNILNIFLIQGIFFGICGIILGLALSFIILFILKNYGLQFLKNIYYLKTLPIEISLKEILIIIFANLIVIFFSSLFPAYRAAKLKNVEALRHD